MHEKNFNFHKAYILPSFLHLISKIKTLRKHANNDIYRYFNLDLKRLASFNYLYLFIITLLSWVIIFFLFLYPGYQNINTQKSIQNKLTNKIRFLDTQIQKQNLLMSNFYKSQNKYKTLRPSSMQNTYNEITQSAKSYNLKIISLNPINNKESRESKKNKKNKQNKISSRKINLKTSGEYTNILEFLDQIKNNSTPIGIEKIAIKNRIDFTNNTNNTNNLDLLLEMNIVLYKFQ